MYYNLNAGSITFWWCYLEEGFGGRWWAWIGKHSLGRPSVIEERLPLKNEAIYSLELDCLHLCCPIPTTPLWSCRYKMGKFPSWGKQVLPTSGKVSLRGGKGGGRWVGGGGMGRLISLIYYSGHRNIWTWITLGFNHFNTKTDILTGTILQQLIQIQLCFATTAL